MDLGLGNFITGAIKGLVGSVSEAADTFIETDDEKRAFELAVKHIAQDRLSELEETVRTEMSAKASIIQAEMNQKDKYTKRARPTVVYFGLGVIGINHLLFPAVARLLVAFNADLNLDTSPLMLPTEFWLAWGGIVTTWTIGRTAEKRGIANKVVSAITGNKPL